MEKLLETSIFFFSCNIFIAFSRVVKIRDYLVKGLQVYVDFENAPFFEWRKSCCYANDCLPIIIETQQKMMKNLRGDCELNYLPRVGIHQPFSRTFFIFISRFYKSNKSNSTSDCQNCIM